MIEIKINGVVKWQVSEYTFTDPQMGIRNISMTVKHPSMWVDGTAPDVADFTGAYVEYDGEGYNITSSKPTTEKSNSALDYIYTLSFKGEEDDLTRRKVRNLAEAGVDSFISQGTVFSIYADINQFIQLLENNLKYYFGSKWTINLTGVSFDSIRVDINNLFLWDLLLKTYEYYGLRWNIRGNTINIGYEPDEILHVFDYGKEGGLVNITRTLSDSSIINRLSGVGSSRNVPMNYFTNRYTNFPLDPNPINDTVNIRNIMPKAFRDSIKNGSLPYIDYVEDADLVSINGVKEDALSPNEDIYPSITGVEIGALGFINELIDVSPISYNKPDDDTYSPSFDIWIKDIGFNLADNIYTTTKDAKISFTSGALAGYEFVILATNGARNVIEDTSKTFNGVPSKYKITLINSEEDFQATGRVLPNAVLKPSAGDTFVVYDIEMPQVYVEMAEQRVQDWLEFELLERKIEKPAYTIEPMASFFESDIVEGDGKTIKEKLKSGNKLTVNNTKITNGAQALYINNLTIQYKDLLAKYTFVVTDKVQVQGSTIARLQSQIESVANRQLLREKDADALLSGMSGKYLSKTSNDTAQGHITLNSGLTSKSPSTFEAGITSKEKAILEKGLQTKDFASGLAGLGGSINEDGVGELRNLTVWESFKATELVFNRVEINVGDKWNAPGRGKIKSITGDIIELDLEEGEIGSIDVDDICMGIFHSSNIADNATTDYDDSKGNRRFSGFFTSYFKVIQIMDSKKSKFRYALRPTSTAYPVQYNPCALMKFTSYGNFTKKERQRSSYETLSYHRYLKDVNNWEFTVDNIAAQRGDLSNLSVYGLDMTGYSEFINNVYFTGIIHQLSGQIRDEIAKTKVGGKNLLREYDIRFDFKYWGGIGEFIDVDILGLTNLPILKLNQNSVSWTYPDNLSTIGISSNTAWTVSTLTEWLLLNKSTGQGDDTVAITSSIPYSGRTDRIGSVSVGATGLTNRIITVTQKGRPEYIQIQSAITVTADGGEVIIVGKTNSSKLTFSLGIGDIVIPIPSTYLANSVITSNGALISGDIGTLNEFDFSIALNIPINNITNSVSRNIIATTANGQTGVCIITQNKAAIVYKLLTTNDGRYIIVGTSKYINVKHN